MSLPGGTGTVHLMTISVATEQDTFALRRCGRAVAGVFGIENQDQVRLATALSELGRDLLTATALTVEFAVTGGVAAALQVTMCWQGGPGPTPEALGAVARLVQLRRAEGCLVVEQPLLGSGESLAGLMDEARAVLGAHGGSSAAEDARAQTRDLIAALGESRAQREELQRLNEELGETNRGVVALYSELSQELEETNRGVVALYGELEEKSRQLRVASEAKTRFWANVSHELRTPVNSVVGLAGLLLASGAGRLDEDQREQIGLISASGSTLLTLVDELLDVAKAESGRLEPVWARVDLRALLAELRGTLGVRAGEGVTLAIADPTTVPAFVSDEVMLTRILRNLLSNALKFTERGSVTLDVALREAPEGEELVLTVADTGVGIPQEQQERVFEEFYQVRGAHQRGRSGTGLGLPYARRLTELLGGTLTLTSGPGEGTRVVVRLPVPGPPVEDPPARVAVLVSVDDDEAYRASVRPLLGELAERIVEVSEGGRAVETVRRERPDAVLLDLHMPDLDGYQVLAQLAADAELCAVPVVVITSASTAGLEHDRLVHARAVLEKATLRSHQLAAAFAAPARGNHPGDHPGGPVADGRSVR